VKGLTVSLREKEAAVECLEADLMRSVDMLERVEVEMYGVEAAVMVLEARERTATHVVGEHADAVERGLGALEESMRWLSSWGEQVWLACV